MRTVRGVHKYRGGRQHYVGKKCDETTERKNTVGTCVILVFIYGV